MYSVFDVNVSFLLDNQYSTVVKSACWAKLPGFEILTLLPSGWVTLGKLINLSVPFSSYVKWGYNSTYLMGLLWGLAQSLSRSKHSTKVSCYYDDDDYYRNCELAIKVWIKGLYFPAGKTDKGCIKGGTRAGAGRTGRISTGRTQGRRRQLRFPPR